MLWFAETLTSKIVYGPLAFGDGWSEADGRSHIWSRVLSDEEDDACALFADGVEERTVGVEGESVTTN